jgi:hypothetical protein
VSRERELEMAINYGKVVTGGLLAGLVMNVIDTTANFTILASDNTDMLTRLHLDPTAMTNLSSAVPFILADFVIALATVWNYAAIRPRLGPGPSTAVMAALVPFVAVTAVLFGFTSLGVFTWGMIIRGSIEALVSTVLGAIAGAWAYTE